MKRQSSITFLLCDTPATVKTIKQELVKVVKQGPSIQSAETGQDVDVKDLTIGSIELGIVASSEKKSVSDHTKTFRSLTDDDEEVTEKVVAWKLTGEEFTIHEYPADEED